mgnify:FL=1
MLRRYELTDDEWNRIAPLLPPENSGKQGPPQNVLGQFLTELFGLPAVERPGLIFQNVMVPGKPSTPVFENGLTMVSLITFSVF